MCCCLWFAALASPATVLAGSVGAGSVGAGSVGAEVRARPVPQEADGLIAAAAWTGDDRFVVTVHDVARYVAIWDARSLDVVNRINFPALDPKSTIDVWDASIDAAGVLTVEANLRDTDSGLCTSATLRMDMPHSVEWQVELGDPLGPCLSSGRSENVARSHSGRLRLNYDDKPARIEDAGGKVIGRLEKPEHMESLAAAPSPDGTAMVLLSTYRINDPDPVRGRQTRVTNFDLAEWKVSASYLVDGFYSRLVWLDNDRVMLFGKDVSAVINGHVVPRSAPLIVAARSGAVSAAPIAVRCLVTALPGGALIGVGGRFCSQGEVDGQRLERLDPAAGWAPFGGVATRGFFNFLGTTPDGQRLIMVTSAKAPSGLAARLAPDQAEALIPTIMAIDARTGARIASAPLPDGSSDWQISFTPDSRTVGIRVDLQNYVWDMTDAAPVTLAETAVPAAMLARQSASRDGSVWYEVNDDSLSRRVSLVRVSEGRREARVLFDNVEGEGAIPGGPLRWAITRRDGIALWRPDAGIAGADPEVLRTYVLDDAHFLSLSPSGRYDTDLGADSASFRWVVSDAPFQSLGPQTFMRNFFEPQLGPRLMRCSVTDTCDTAFRPVASLAAINRVLPTVRIARVSAGSVPGTAQIDVEVRRGQRVDTPNGRTGSDGYDLRLFRNGSLVARSPDREPDGLTFDIGQWRAANRLTPGRAGVARARFTAKLPSGTAPVAFSAYAFNEDRVKSETAQVTYPPPAGLSRPRRVFVVAMGIDAYAEARLRLNFAADDARLIGTRLASLPDGEAARVLVLPDDGAPGSPRVTRAVVADVFGLLAGEPRDATLARLKAQGIDAAMLDAATPDDIVVIAYSGHGWADPQGNFYLLPQDAKWPDITAPPAVATLVSTSDMARVLRRIDAGEIALIIDACHSAASVSSGGFRAGPMGDAGLGQLAFDKRMRILAATQADDVALESAKLRQGLLTFALANEGVTADGGMADENGDHAITLDEWLRYATRRLPGLSRDLRSGRISGARGVVLLDRDDTPAAQQDPALFDFTGRRSALVLRRLAP